MSISLNDFRPVSELIVNRTDLTEPAFPVIDFHTHFGWLAMGDDYPSLYETPETVEKLKAAGVELVVNMDGFFEDELDRMLKKTEGYEDYIKTFGTVNLEKFEDPDFETYVFKTINALVHKGGCGLKLWKNLGLHIRGKNGKYLRSDDPRLKCIWETAAELDIPVLIHQADPVAFFKPSVPENERIEEMDAHPDWVFNTPGLYSFQELMEMQEHFISENPKTKFVIAHCGSYAENLAQVGRWLDAYPNMMIDIAERINELGRQPYTAKAFFEKYQDRIIFGTDYIACNEPRHLIYYRFLETMDEYFDYSNEPVPPQGRWRIYGIGLSRDVLQKIYRDNALKLLPAFRR